MIMKFTIIILALLFNITLSAQLQKTEEEMKVQKIVSKMAFNFIQEEYVKVSKEKIPKLERQLNSYKSKFARSTNVKFKKKALEAIKETEIELNAAKLWDVYYKAYVIMINSRNEGDIPKYKEARTVVNKVKKKYSELKAEEFPNIESAFSKKYFKTLQKLYSKTTTKK